MSSLAETLETWLLAALDGVHTCVPGRVEEYFGHKERRARVVPMVRPQLQSGELVAIKPIQDVPVMFPSSSSGGVLFPLKAGDGVLLVFSEVGIGNYLHGRANVIADADDPSRFSLSDCIAIPGLWNFAGAPTTKQTDTATGIESAKGAYLGLAQKVQLKNDVSTLKKELDALYDIVLGLHDKLSTWAPLISPGVPTTPNPLQVAPIALAKAAAQLKKTALGNFLED